MKEETNLDVRVLSLLVDELSYPGGVYQQLKTYPCVPIKGEASPGIELELTASSKYSIVEVKWFDLRNEARWDTELINDPIIYLPLQRIRKKLGLLT